MNGYPFLDLFFYAAILIPPAFLALGSILNYVSEPISAADSKIFCIVSCLIVIIGSIIQTKTDALHFFYQNEILIFITLLFLVFFSIILQVALFGKRKFFIGILLVLLIVLFNIGCYPLLFPKDHGSESYELEYFTVTDSFSVIKNYTPENPSKLLFWFNSSETTDATNVGRVFTLINFEYLGIYSNIGTSFPQLSRDEMNNLDYKLFNNQVRLVILHTNENILLKELKELEKRYSVKIIDQKHILSGPYEYNITFIDLSKKSDILDQFNFQQQTGYAVIDTVTEKTRYYYNNSNQTPGYILFGPYIPLQPGDYILNLTIKANNISDVNGRLMTIDIPLYENGSLQKQEIITSKDLFMSDLGINPTSLTFKINNDNMNNLVEFRVLQYGHCNISIEEVSLSKTN
jgi:hypothetical protein